MKVKLRKILLFMSKLTVYALALTCSFTFALAAHVEAQRQELSEIRINISTGQKSLLKSLSEIEENSNFVFAYTSKELTNKIVNIRKAGWRMDELLREISMQTDLSFKRVNETITIRKKNTNDNLPPLIDEIIQTRNITGKVTSSEDKEVLPGVNVVEKGTSNGTVTDVQGSYSLEVSEGATLVFSSVGYTTEEINVGNQAIVNVVLNSDIKQLQELVVVGYGVQKKSDLTGSVGSISQEAIKEMPMTSLDQGLQGRVAGVQVTQTDAAPGGAISIRIRGGNSITGNNEPLYVIDGYPVLNDPIANTGRSGSSASQTITTNPLASINPNDIESVEILKDASATSIYGSRGANGVVIITTKKGKTGQSHLDFEYYTGIQNITKKIPVLNLREYAELTNDAYVTDGRNKPFPDVDQLVDSLNGGTNWQDEIFRTAPVSNYQLTFSKGTDNTRYIISGNYFKQKGIVIGSEFERLSFRFNLDSDISEKFRVGNNFTVSYLDNNEALVNDGGTGSAGVVHNAITAAPYMPIYDENGNYFVDWQQIGPVFRRDNPVALALSTTNQTLTGRALGNFYAEYEIIEGLTAKTSIGADVRYLKRNLYIPRTTYRGYFENGIGDVQTNQIFNWLNENTLTYQKNFNQRHDLNILLGFTLQRENREIVRARGEGFVNDILGYNDLGSASTIQPSSTGANEWSLMSYISRINYILNNKYLFTFTARADGSSRFGENNKFGFFPSGAVAWRLSDEEFVKNMNLFSDLKLRTSYGITGNQEIPLYRSQSSLGNSNYILGNNLAIGISPNRVANPDLKWEKTTQFDVGLDFAFNDHRLRFTMDYYYKKTNDLLLEVTIPWTSGYSTSLQNIGSTENKGFEFSIGADILTGEFKWNMDANYSMNRNKILDLGEITEFIGPESGAVGFYSPGPAIIVREGESVNSFYGYVSEGLFRTSEDIANSPTHRYMELGDLRFKDVNEDGVISPDDRTIIGNAQPNFIYGINNNFKFKNFDLAFFIQGVQGNEVLNVLRVYELESMRGTHNNTKRAVDRWTPENINAAMPKADRRGQETFVNTNNVEDGSFIRLKNVVLGYNLPINTISWIRSARIYMSGQNLWTRTNYTGFDPEVNSFGQNAINQGIDYGAYPRAKTFTLGVNVGL